MAQLGRINSLKILRLTAPGMYLDGGAHGDILLPGALIPAGAVVGGTVDVFVYRDSEDRPVATTEHAYAQVGEVAYLRVTGINHRVGVFLDWGLSKDLLLPAREQTSSLGRGDWVVVFIYVDIETDRIVASMRLNRHINRTPPPFREGEEVRLLVTNPTPLGFNAVINHTHTGLLYRNEVPALTIGQSLRGYIRAVREDGKIDLGLDPVGHRRIATGAERVMEILKNAGGKLPFHDGSTPEEIRATFEMSKKAFKQAIGTLFKARQIVITETGIELAPEKSPAKKK